MATDWVVDASIAVKSLVQEPDADRARQLMDGVMEHGRLLAPALLRYEVGNASRRHGLPADFETLLAQSLTGIEWVEPRNVAKFASSLSYYDAAYVALAVESGAGLMTSDEAMRKVAKKHGIELLP